MADDGLQTAIVRFRGYTIRLSADSIVRVIWVFSGLIYGLSVVGLVTDAFAAATIALMGVNLLGIQLNA